MSTEAFTVRAESGIIAFIDDICGRTDRSRNYIVNEALKRYVEEERNIILQVMEGYSQSEKGQKTDHDKFFKKFLSENKINED